MDVLPNCLALSSRTASEASNGFAALFSLYSFYSYHRHVVAAFKLGVYLRFTDILFYKSMDGSFVPHALVYNFVFTKKSAKSTLSHLSFRKINLKITKLAFRKVVILCKW